MGQGQQPRGDSPFLQPAGVGRIVHYYPPGTVLGSTVAPLAAVICAVFDPGVVNLAGWDGKGNSASWLSVPLIQGDMPTPTSRGYAVWPPRSG